MGLFLLIALIKKCQFYIQTQFSTNVFNTPNSTLYLTTPKINFLTFRKNYAKPYCSGGTKPNVTLIRARYRSVPESVFAVFWSVIRSVLRSVPRGV